MYNNPAVSLVQYNKALKFKRERERERERGKHRVCGISDKNKLPETKHGQTSDKPKLRDILVFFKNMKNQKRKAKAKLTK